MRNVLNMFKQARSAPTVAGQVEAILSVNGFIRFHVTGEASAVVSLDRGHYQVDRHRRLALAQMPNRLMDYGLLAETRDGCLHVTRRGGLT